MCTLASPTCCSDELVPGIVVSQMKAGRVWESGVPSWLREVDDGGLSFAMEY